MKGDWVKRELTGSATERDVASNAAAKVMMRRLLKAK